MERTKSYLSLFKVEVVQPFFSTADLESELRKTYDLKKVTVIPNLIDNKEALIRDINRALLNDLKKLVSDGDILSFSWGNSMTSLAEEAETFDRIQKEDVKIVQLTGGASSVVKQKDPSQIVRSFGNLFNSEAYQICAPTVVKDTELAESIKRDPQIKRVLDLAKNSDIAILSAGTMKKNKLIYQLGCLDEEDISAIKESAAVGDICTHFIEADGSIAVPAIDKRSIALSLEDIKKIPEKILVVTGTEKAQIVKSILENGLADRLYLDEELAKAILKQ